MPRTNNGVSGSGFNVRRSAHIWFHRRSTQIADKYGCGQDLWDAHVLQKARAWGPPRWRGGRRRASRVEYGRPPRSSTRCAAQESSGV
eukprot:3025555-Prymnesium_polylepis.1